MGFHVFSAKGHASNFYLSGFMGDRQDLRVLKKKDAKRHSTVLKIIYTPSSDDPERGWAGLAWQYPQNNWGTSTNNGCDLSGARFLSFQAYGLYGKEQVEFKIGGIPGLYGDSDEAATGIITLTTNWRSYRIDLRNKDLKNIIAGFSFLIMHKFNTKGAVFSLMRSIIPVMKDNDGSVMSYIMLKLQKWPFTRFFLPFH